MYLEIIKPGTPVKIDEEIEGIVDFVNINKNVVKYHVQWWNGKTLQEAYFDEYRLSTEYHKHKIGFK